MTIFWLLVVLADSVLCFALGLAVGIKVQHRKLTREVPVQARSITQWYRKRQWLIVGVFLMLMALLTYQSQRESDGAVHAVQDQNGCLTTYANQLYDSLKPRQSASESLQAADEAFNDALVTLLREALSPTSGMDRRREDALALAAAAQHKQKIADQLSAERAKNPYPQPPKKVCPK